MPSLGGAAGGATAGFTAGSFLPGIGNLAGAGIGALLGGLFGGGKNDDEKKKQEQAGLDPYTKLLQESAAGKRAEGDRLSGMSEEALRPVLDYFGKIMSGDPQALLDATKSQRGRVIDQYDAARQAIGNFGPRGGGSAAAIGESRFAEANALSDITSDAQNNAASTLAGLGPQLAGLGLSADQLASSDLGAVIQAVLAQKGIDITQRGQNLDALTGIGEAIGSIIGLVMTRGSGK